MYFAVNVILPSDKIMSHSDIFILDSSAVELLRLQRIVYTVFQILKDFAILLEELLISNVIFSNLINIVISVSDNNLNKIKFYHRKKKFQHRKNITRGYFYYLKDHFDKTISVKILHRFDRRAFSQSEQFGHFIWSLLRILFKQLHHKTLFRIMTKLFHRSIVLILKKICMAQVASEPFILLIINEIITTRGRNKKSD